MKQLLAYEVDLTRLQENGDFLCPKCGIKISPDDETDSIYCVLEPKVKDNNLEEIIIHCQKCSSNIRLTGFSYLNF